MPSELAAQIPPGQLVRVLLLIPESAEERDWEQFTAEEFLKGYAESDAIYDPLSGS